MELSGGLIERPTEGTVGQGRIPFYVDFGFVRKEIADGAKFAEYDLKMGTPTKGDIEVTGYASTWVKDRDKEYVSKHAFDQSLGAYLSKNPIILYQHERDKPLGQVLKGAVDDTGLMVDGWIRKPGTGEADWKVSAYNDIKSGILRTFSIGGFFDREMIENEVLITNVELFEISVVSIPSNPDTIYQAAVKAAKGLDPQTGGISRHADQAVQLLGLEQISDPLLAKMTERERIEHYVRLAREVKRANGVELPDYHAYRRLAHKLEHEDISSEEALATLERLLTPLSTLGANTGVLPPDGGELDGLVEAAKAGRVLSAKNEKKLRDAHTAIGQVLDQVGSGEGSGASTTDGKGAEDAGDADISAAEELDILAANDEYRDEEKSWDGSASNYTDAQYAAACILDRADCGDAWKKRPAKVRYSVPVKRPGSDSYAPEALGPAAAALNGRGGIGVKACPAAIKKAKARLVRCYQAVGQEPPDSIKP